MMRGFDFPPDVMETYQDMKLREKYKYIILKVSGDKIVIDELGDPGKTFDEYKAKFEEVISAKDCRFTVFDFQFETDNRRLIKKIAIINWMPKSAAVKTKMTYENAKEKVKELFSDIRLNFDLCQISDADYTALTEEVARSP